MKPYWTDKFLATVVMAMLTTAVGCSGIASQPPDTSQQSGSPPFSESLVLSRGTPIHVRLQQPISSSTAETGQTFSAVLDEALVAHGRTIAPEGTTVSGRVVAARKSGYLRDAGYLRVTLSSVTVNGKEIPVQTSSVFVEGGTYKNRKLAYTGGGSGLNALMEALAESGNSSAGGSVVGNSDGSTAAYVNGKKEVGFAADRRMSFRLIEPLNIG